MSISEGEAKTSPPSKGKIMKHSYACIFFNDVECPKSKRLFIGLGCWCDKAESRKSEDKPKFNLDK